MAGDIDLRFPIIVKPLTRRPDLWRSVADAGKALRVDTPADLYRLWPRLSASGLPLLAQEMIPGPETCIESYHVYVDEQGEIVAEFTGRKVRTYPREYGDSSALVTTDAADVAALGRNLVKRLDLRGVAKFDFKRAADGGLYLLEVNPRFNLWHHLGAVAGVNLPALVYGDAVGLPRPAVASARAGIRWCRMWQDALAARASGTDFTRWLRWALGCEAKRMLAWDDPMPFVRAGLWRSFPWRRNNSSKKWPIVGKGIGGFEGFPEPREKIERKFRGGREGVQRNGRGKAIEPLSEANQYMKSNPQMKTDVVIREATSQELMSWDDLVAGFDNYRIVHKRGWMRSLEACVKGKPLYLVFEKECQVVGCLPGFLVNFGPFRIFGSPLPGWQTLSMGPVFDRSRLSSSEMMPALVNYLETHHRVYHMELLADGLDHEVMEKMHFQCKPSATFRAPMFPDDPERTLKNLKESARRNVRRAIKLGLVVKFEEDESFVDEHYDQLVEVYTRGGNVIPFSKKRALEFFRHMKMSGNLLAVSVSLPDGGPCIATGTFTVEGRELLLWMWAHRTQYRWYRPTELMTWTVMKKAMEAGCVVIDFMGRGDFKAKFGAELGISKYRWIRSRYHWLLQLRLMAERGYRWQQSFRGRRMRERMASMLTSVVKPIGM